MVLPFFLLFSFSFSSLLPLSFDILISIISNTAIEKNDRVYRDTGYHDFDNAEEVSNDKEKNIWSYNKL